MDRLLVGDVGFGKTEVALRAAFKAIKESKQVAFLVPTTILAQQHYETMLDRFEGFPVNVGLFKPFSNEETANGNDRASEKGPKLIFLVGTHRLLSKDVEFADLGLLVIDEEQRFWRQTQRALETITLASRCSYIDGYPDSPDTAYVHVGGAGSFCD